MRLGNPFRNRFGLTFRKQDFSSHTEWIHHNQLFQRHPRLMLLENPRAKTPHHLHQILSYVFVSGLHRNPFVMGRLLYFSLFELEGDNSGFGLRIFNSTEKPNIFSYNTMIRFFDPAIALRCYSEMLRREIPPDKYTFTFLLRARGPTFDLCTVQQLHCHILKLVSCRCLFVENSLLSAYLSCCDSETLAQKVFDEMPERDIVTWTSLISGLVSQANYSRALRVFKDLLEYEHPRARPNLVTIISAMSTCSGLGSTNLTKCFHSYLEKYGWLELDISIVNSLIDAYAKCGCISNLNTLFSSIQNSRRDLYSWTAIISGYAMLGQGPDALKIFSRMKEESNLIPDDVTFVAILSACAHSGLVEEGLLIFESMVRKYEIKPNLKHYGCVVDLLGRAGMVVRAYEVVESMPMEPNLAVLGSLLSGCRLHNNLDIAKGVLRKIEGLKERGGADVLLSNIYANENRWSEVMDIRKEMRGKMKGKPPGRSWIQIKDEVHEFIARNQSVGEDIELHVLLEGMKN